MLFRQSYAKTLLYGCPRELQCEIETGGRQPSKVMDAGSAVDMLLTGGADKLVVLDHPDFRTKAAKAERDEARGKGFVPVLKKDYLGYSKTAEHVRAQLAMRDVDLDNCKTQRRIEWSGTDGVACHGTPDIVCPDGMTIDLKCGDACSPDRVASQAWDMCWDVQGAAYQEATRGNGRHVIARAQVGGAGLFTWVELSPFYLEVGLDRLNHARAIFKRCVEKNEWPQWPETMVDPPEYKVSRWMERSER